MCGSANPADLLESQPCRSFPSELQRYKPMAGPARSSIFPVLAITLLTAVSCGSCPPFPSVTSLSPSSKIGGGNQFLLTVNGTDFRDNSVVNWNGSFVPTTFVSTHELVATITASDIAKSGTVTVSVLNPADSSATMLSGAIGTVSTTACSGKISNSLAFTVNP